MTESASVTTWVGLLRAGNAGAANELWKRYYPRLVELARAHLARNVRQAADEEDVALSAFAGFCAGVAAGRFPQLDNRHDLWRLLFKLTLCRARDHAARETRQKRDVRRTAALGLLDLPGADLDRLAGDAPDPALAAEVADELRHLLSILPGADLRTVARDLLEGYTALEVARRQGCGLRSVERRWQRVKQFWQAQAEKNEEKPDGGGGGSWPTAM